MLGPFNTHNCQALQKVKAKLKRTWQENVFNGCFETKIQLEKVKGANVQQECAFSVKERKKLLALIQNKIDQLFKKGDGRRSDEIKHKEQLPLISSQQQSET